MRIIAGLRRGHKIGSLEGTKSRPTSDRVREAIFNILADQVEDREVFDLFAGTGAMGLEALSRGAKRATFVELNRDQVALIRRNIATLRFEDRTHVAPIDAYRWLRGLPPMLDSPIIAILDPPYPEYQNHPARFRRGLELLLTRTPPGSVIVVEGPERFPTSVLPEPDLWDIRRYSSAVAAFRTVGEE